MRKQTSAPLAVRAVGSMLAVCAALVMFAVSGLAGAKPVGGEAARRIAGRVGETVPFSRIVGARQQVTVSAGETLRVLAARYGIDPATIAADNGLKNADRLTVGQILTVDSRHIVPDRLSPGSIIVNIPQRMLFVDAETLLGVPVAVGRRSWPTPVGAFVIRVKEEQPTWDVPASIQAEARRAGRSLPDKVLPGPDNPLGEYWLGLSLDSVGIHSTNAPASIYQAVTHGCIRVHPDHIKAVFEAVQKGTVGAVIYEPILVTEAGGEVLLEVHPDVYGRGPADRMAYVRAAVDRLGSTRVDWLRVAQVLASRAGIARVVSVPADVHVR